MQPPAQGSCWVGLTQEPLPVDEASRWVVLPTCGAAVTFCGTARDHAPGRPGVSLLQYEAYEEIALERLRELAAEVQRRFPDVGRVALLHRLGPLELGETAVVVAVSTPHRHQAFDAARFGIDALKATVPIWKKERWDGGDDWGTGATDVASIEDLPR